MKIIVDKTELLRTFQACISASVTVARTEEKLAAEKEIERLEFQRLDLMLDVARPAEEKHGDPK